MPHFHDFNPWASELAYIPDLDEFVDALDPFYNRERYKNRLRTVGKYDVYVLSNGDLGVRFGREESQYLSPASNEPKAKALWAKYSGAKPE